MTAHKPVLLQEVLEIFNPKPGQIYIDATINGGGHSKEILNKVGDGGKILGIDWDCQLLEKLQKANLKNLKLVCDSYANLKDIAESVGFKKVDGILFDLGFSSYHPERSGRGFSFQKDEPLDMRYNIHSNELTAEKIVNTWNREAIENLLRAYGEEQYAGRITRGILWERKNKKIITTKKLIEVIEKNVPRRYLRGRLNPATRTFQALRIAVNKELENLEVALPQAVELLETSGKLIIISFHSLEDRIIKNFFKQKDKEKVLKILTRKPLVSSWQEVKINPRARSAKLRTAQKL